MRPFTARLTLLPLALLAATQPVLASDSFVGSMTVLGPANRELLEGAESLERGNMARGVELTRIGLKSPGVSRDDRAAGESNLCGGYAALRLWDLALAHCLAAIELNPDNWRTYNNRAATYVGRGDLDRALADVETALSLAPGSQTLKLSLQIVLDHRRVSREKAQRARSKS